MKKHLSITLAVLLLFVAGIPVVVEGTPLPTPSRSAFSLSGRVVAGESISLTAPYGGKVLDYTVRAGDMVRAGQTVFDIETTKVFALCDGIVGGIRAAPGDEASYIQERYGALMYLEPDTLLKIDTNTSEAHDSNDNKLIRVGETVYVQSNSSKNRIGVGYVTQVNGTGFSIEITHGNLRVSERASIFRNEAYENTSRIGVGRTERLNPVAVTGEGSVLRVHVAEGTRVKRGDLLAEMVSGVFPSYSTQAIIPEIKEDCIVLSIAVQPGAQVSSGQVLATLYPATSLEVAADINELDLHRIQVGDAVLVELTALKEQGLFEGTVTAISALSSTDSGDAEYTVYVRLSADATVREGMSATVYLAE